MIFQLKHAAAGTPAMILSVKFASLPSNLSLSSAYCYSYRPPFTPIAACYVILTILPIRRHSPSLAMFSMYVIYFLYFSFPCCYLCASMPVVVVIVLHKADLFAPYFSHCILALKGHRHARPRYWKVSWIRLCNLCLG